MKKLIIALIAIVSTTSFASECRTVTAPDDQLRFESSCHNGEITFEVIRIKHEGKYLKVGPVQGVPAKLLCKKLGLEYVSYEIKEYIFPRTIAIVHEEKEGSLLVNSIAKESYEYAAYNGLDEVVCK